MFQVLSHQNPPKTTNRVADRQSVRAAPAHATRFRTRRREGRQLSPLGLARTEGPSQFLLTLILMVFGFASSFLGIVSVRTPSLKLAATLSASMLPGSEKVRVKAP